MKTIQELERFFELDLKVKKLIEVSRPNLYDADPVEIESKLMSSVNSTRLMLNQMVLLSGLDLEEEFDELHENILNDIKNCNYNINKLESVYENDFLRMTNGFEDSLEENIFGYCNKEKIYIPLEHCKTINDMLHYVHFYVMNNEDTFKNMDEIDVKKQDDEVEWMTYKLYGKDTEIARDIFNKLPENETKIDEVSFDNHIIIMVRDRGHALTIDVQNELDHYRVSYYIPKICNIDMVNSLKGISKVDPNKKSDFDSAHGEFVVDKSSVGDEVNKLITSVPTDEDIKRVSIEEMFRNARKM